MNSDNTTVKHRARTARKANIHYFTTFFPYSARNQDERVEKIAERIMKWEKEASTTHSQRSDLRCCNDTDYEKIKRNGAKVS